jgi:hypothetical protein
MRTGHFRRYCPAALAVLLAVVSMSPAYGDILQFNGSEFGDDQFFVDDLAYGLYEDDGNRAYLAVHFSKSGLTPDGVKLCRVILIAKDNASVGISARVTSKSKAVGTDAYAAPVILAAVASNGAAANLRKFSGPVPAVPPTIDERVFNYYIEVDIDQDPSPPPFPNPQNLAVLTVQVDYRPTCPAL